MRVIVTGIAGFIGFHLARKLSARGVEVVGLDNINDYYDPALKRARLKALPTDVIFHEMDLTDAPGLLSLFAQNAPDVVVHLAAQAGVRYSIENPHAYAQSNLVGHLNILEACRHQAGLSHLVYASSSSVYGGNEKVPFSESDPVDHPVSLYAATKRSGELLSDSYATLYGLKQIGLRFFTVYGPWGRPDMAYWLFADKMLRGASIKVFNNGQLRRDFTYIDDIVEGILATIEKPVFQDADPTPHRLYNIGNNAPVPLLEFIETLERVFGVNAEKTMLPMQQGDVLQTFADIENLKRDYGFAPSTRLEDGLSQFADWFRKYQNGDFTG